MCNLIGYIKGGVDSWGGWGGCPLLRIPGGMDYEIELIDEFMS